MILLVSVVGATVNDATAYYSFDTGDYSGDDIYDLSGVILHNATNVLATVSSTGKLNTSWSFEGNDYISVDNSAELNFDNTDSFSVCAWINKDTYGAKEMIFNKIVEDNEQGYGCWVQAMDNAIVCSIEQADNTNTEINGNTALTNNIWYHFCFVRNVADDVLTLYLNGVQDTANVTDTTTATLTNTIDLWIGKQHRSAAPDYFDGEIDEFAIYNKALTTSEITLLYNSGTGYNPYGTPTSANFTVTITDTWDSTNVNNISIILDGTTYKNTTGNVVTTNKLSNDTTLYNIVMSANNYLDKTESNYNISLSGNLGVTLHQSEIDFDVFEYISGDVVVSPDCMINSTIQSCSTLFNLSEGNYTVIVNKTGYYNKSFNVSIVPLQIETVNLSGLYNSVVTVNLTDIVTSDLITSDSFISIDNNAGWTNNVSNTNGTIGFNLLQGNYSLTLWADNFAFREVNVTVNNLTEFFTYGLYANNSLWVTAVDFNTSASLVNFSMNVYNANNSYTADDNGSGTITLNNVASGIYTVNVLKDGYASSSYVLTMVGGSHQNIVSYLVQSPLTSIFTIVDIITDSILYDSQVNMYKLFNSTWVLVSSEKSDITGRVEISYLDGVEYKFVVDKAGYDQRTFFLEILFSTYTVRLTPETSTSTDVVFGDWVYEIGNNGNFYDDSINNFSVSISSGTGTIEYYNLTVTNFDGVVYSVGCVNSYGCSDDFSLNITGATFDQHIYVNYTIKETGRSPKTYSYLYLIQNIYSDETMYGWSGSGGVGFGDLEKAFVATILMLIVVGAVAMASIALGVPAVTTSGLALAVLAGVLASVGFIPNYSAWIIGCGVLLIVVFGRGEI